VQGGFLRAHAASPPSLLASTKRHNLQCPDVSGQYMCTLDCQTALRCAANGRVFSATHRHQRTSQPKCSDHWQSRWLKSKHEHHSTVNSPQHLHTLTVQVVLPLPLACTDCRHCAASPPWRLITALQLPSESQQKISITAALCCQQRILPAAPEALPSGAQTRYSIPGAAGGWSSRRSSFQILQRNPQ
jgi:hypothetical protein